MVQCVSGLKKDFIASYLRSQLAMLQSLLRNVEESERIEDGYFGETLKRMEREIRQLRKVYDN